MLFSVRWNGKFIIDPMLFRFDINWLRRTTVLEILVYVLKEAAPIRHASIDDADEISLFLARHIDECIIGGAKRVVKVNVRRMMDEDIYVVIGCAHTSI